MTTIRHVIFLTAVLCGVSHADSEPQHYRFEEYVRSINFKNPDQQKLKSVIAESHFWVYVQQHGPQSFAFITATNQNTGKQTAIVSQRKELIVKTIKGIMKNKPIPRSNLILIPGKNLFKQIYSDTEISFLVDDTNVTLSVKNVAQLKSTLLGNSSNENSE